MKLIKDSMAKGFTLVEMLLVMVIITVIIMMGTSYMQQKATSLRIDKTALQMQYILNAALAYYIANGTWPGPQNQAQCTGGCGYPDSLQPDYLSSAMTVNPWGQYYLYYYKSSNYLQSPQNTFSVMTFIPGTTAATNATASIIAGKLPTGFTVSLNWPFGSVQGTTVVAYVNVPGQNLNNAMAVNFAGLYHQGGCVPVPTCPNTTASGGVTMSPQIFVVPVSVSGVNDPNSSNIYPISSFTAFATAMGSTGGSPPACYSGDTAVSCTPINGNAPQTDQYWRVCLQVITQRGDVQVTNKTSSWGQDVTLAAFTRCSISDEPAGSTFSVYTH